jgi:hypothetical protein
VTWSSLLALVLDLLGSSVDLLLAFLGTTTEAEDQVKGRLLLDVVVRKSASVFKLLASEDQTLLIRGNSFFLLCPDVSQSTRGIHGEH